MKAILEPDAVNAYIEFHKKMQLPFTITLTNYTTRIKSLLHDIHFMKTEQSNRVFAAYSMVKAQVTKHKIEKVKNYDLQYFSHAFREINLYSDLVFNIDLKSAYATILFNDKLIDQKTFSYLSALPKMERLAAVGMLAGKKNIFEVGADGEIISERTEISETADYFFYCVKRTSEIINECSQYLGKGFLFSWVDGIYFLENPDSAMNSGKIIQEFLEEKGFKSSLDKLTEFNVELRKEYFNCTYKKEGELKVMKVPRLDNVAVKKITNYLLKKNY